MNWWKPQDKNQTTKIRFNATPNNYSSTHWVKGTGKSGCPICNELESEKTRRDNLFAFLKNIGAEDSAVGKAILKVSDEKIAISIYWYFSHYWCVSFRRPSLTKVKWHVRIQSLKCL